MEIHQFGKVAAKEAFIIPNTRSEHVITWQCEVEDDSDQCHNTRQPPAVNIEQNESSSLGPLSVF